MQPLYKKSLTAIGGSPVLSWGAVLILTLLLVYPLLGLWDALILKRQTVAELLDKVKKVESVKSSQVSDWEKKTATLNERHEALLKHFRTAASVGVVKVDIRDWLESLITKSGLSARITVGASDLQASSYYPHWRVSVTLSGQGKPETVLPLIREIEQGAYFSSFSQVTLASHSYELLVDMVVLQEKQKKDK